MKTIQLDLNLLFNSANTHATSTARENGREEPTPADPKADESIEVHPNDADGSQFVVGKHFERHGRNCRVVDRRGVFVLIDLLDRRPDGYLVVRVHRLDEPTKRGNELLPAGHEWLGSLAELHGKWWMVLEDAQQRFDEVAQEGHRIARERVSDPPRVETAA
jgi:hypothetical protein